MICSVDICPKTASARGWCRTHYSRWQRHGDPLGGSSRRPTSVPAGSCLAIECSHLAKSQGLCVLHYARWKRHGNVNYGRPTASERFWNRVEKTNFHSLDNASIGGCWIYTGAKVRGYGVFSVDNKTVSAHRWAYTQLVGPIPDGLTLDHLCYTRNCVRPEHLEPVTASENIVRSHGRVHYVVLGEYDHFTKPV